LEKQKQKPGQPRAAHRAPAGPPPPARQLPPARAARAAEQPDRRLNILLAAEKLFAQHGYHGVSIRDIAAEAGVPLALVGYHYGAKHELYHAIFESWRPSIDERLAALQAAMSEPQAGRRLDGLLDAFVSPIVRLHQHPQGRYYALMAARDLAVPTPEADSAHREFFDPMAHAFIDAMMSLAPHATRGQVAWGYQFMLGALLHYLTDRRVERLSGGENRAVDPEAKAQLLVFIGTGLRALLGLAGTAANGRAAGRAPRRAR
jgi:AcrR family transcriptional regulator